MNNEQKILDFLNRHQQSYDDDQLSELLSIEPRQQVNHICHRLEDHGKIQRLKVSKVRNRMKR